MGVNAAALGLAGAVVGATLAGALAAVLGAVDAVVPRTRGKDDRHGREQCRERRPPG